MLNRKQYVSVTGGYDSSLADVKFGVPQGSLLVPLLFLIDINDLKPLMGRVAKWVTSKCPVKLQ